MDTTYSEDEDVILPNSPLYEHLKETGFQDPYNEETKICAAHEGNVEISERKKASAFDWNKVQVWIMKMKNSVFCSLKDFLESLFLPEVKTMQNRFKKETLQIVMGGGLLIEEDTTFLKAYTACDFKNSENNGGKFWLAERTVFPLLLLPLLFLTRSISACLPLDSLHFILLDKFVIYPVSAFLLVLFSSRILLFFFFDARLKSALKNLRHMCTALKDLSSSFRKCIRIVQEAEMIARGFTLVAYIWHISRLPIQPDFLLAFARNYFPARRRIPYHWREALGKRRTAQESEVKSLVKKQMERMYAKVSVSGLAQRLELSVDLPVLKPNRQYPEFRKSLFSWLKNVFIKHKEAALNVINCLPLSENFDCYSHYIATLNLEDFGDILNLDIASPQSFSKLLEVTDNFSLSCLKSILQLTEVQISEYLKIIYLYTHFTFRGEGVQSVILEFRKLVWLNNVLYDLLKYDDAMMLEVTETHKYYQSIEESTHLKGDMSSPESNNTSFSCLRVCVHSLSLHLKAALKRVNDMEDVLCSEDKSLKDIIDPAIEMTLKDKISHLMSEAKAELDSSKECLLDSCKKLNSLFPPETKVNEPEIPTPTRVPEPVCTQPLQIIPNSDPVPEDEVFEAFISESKSTEENDQGSDWFETEMKQRKENEASSRMMRELRVVLASKAEEHKAREQLALSLKYGKDVGNENVGIDSLPVDKEDKDSCIKASENKEESSKLLSSNLACSASETCESKLSFDVVHKSDTQSGEYIMNSSMLQNFGLPDLQTDISSSNIPGHRTEGEAPKTPKCSGDSGIEGEKIEYKFYPAMGKSFASSIAALAAKRNELCGLGSETFVGDSDDSSDESCD